MGQRDPLAPTPPTTLHALDVASSGAGRGVWQTTFESALTLSQLSTAVMATLYETPFVRPVALTLVLAIDPSALIPGASADPLVSSLNDNISV